jgi:hypothetical protein
MSKRDSSFSLWFIYGVGYSGVDIIEKVKAGSTVRSCIDTVRCSGHFHNKFGADKTFKSFGLEPGDFDTIKEFCRKKCLEYLPQMWEQFYDIVSPIGGLADQIWVHRSSGITPR